MLRPFRTLAFVTVVAVLTGCGATTDDPELVVIDPVPPPTTTSMPMSTTTTTTIDPDQQLRDALAFAAAVVEYAEAVTRPYSGDRASARRGASTGHAMPPEDAPASANPSLEPCGADDGLPPCEVARRESGGSYSAYNPTGCGGRGCFGKWQFSGEWACKLGLPCDLASATPEQQDNAARELWAGGAGCSNWAAC